MRTPGPGAACDFDQISCYDPSARPKDTVAWNNKSPGDYLLIFKALRPGNEGHIDATISAFRMRSVDCNNPVNCSDPTCFGFPACFANYCKPDFNFGPMNPGDSKMVHLDVAGKGSTGYTNVSCARGTGGGKALVVQLTIASTGALGGAGIGFDCTETGDQVIDLFAAGGPRDRCDLAVDQLVCADPQALPFGCGYEVPNLQAGTYNVVVEGYAPGSEGMMDLTLSVVDDRQLVDCRQPGACSQRQCATTQYCRTMRCRPDATIDPVPLDGSSAFKLVQTAGSTEMGNVPCVTTPGGGTAVVEINLTANADLKMSWNQIGNHDFAVYTRAGSVLPCDAGTVVSCQRSQNTPNGAATFSKVPAGHYYLVIAPDTAAGAGSVDVAISGTPSK
jgi:hypothetical protein